jgi:hypothetical protein
MNRKSLLLVLALLPVTAVASAEPGTSTTRATPPGTAAGALPISCTTVFDGLITKLKAGDKLNSVHTTLIDGEVAYAEGKMPAQSGFVPPPSSARLIGQTVAIQSLMTAPSNTGSSSKLMAVLEKAGDKVRLKWTHAGKTHTSTVDTCSSGFWTAADATSAFVVKLGKPEPTAIPE